MTVEIIEKIEDPDSDHIEEIYVETVDGKGDQRIYLCGLGPDMLGAEYLIGYRQLSGPEGSRPHKTDAVADVAREYWSTEGYRVFGVEEGSA